MNVSLLFLLLIESWCICWVYLQRWVMVVCYSCGWPEQNSWWFDRSWIPPIFSWTFFTLVSWSELHMWTVEFWCSEVQKPVHYSCHVRAEECQVHKHLQRAKRTTAITSLTCVKILKRMIFCSLFQRYSHIRASEGFYPPENTLSTFIKLNNKTSTGHACVTSVCAFCLLYILRICLMIWIIVHFCIWGNWAQDMIHIFSGQMWD